MANDLPGYAVEVYEDWGWNVLPAPRGAKSPVVSWRKYQREPITEDEIRAAFEDTRNPDNLWVATGKVSGIIVLDTDTEEGHAYWYEQIPEAMDAAPRVKTSKGWHYYFAYPHDGDGQIPNTSGDGWDTRGDGGGVIIPPSEHESGHVYTWDEGRDPDDVGLPALPGLLRESQTAGAGTGDAGESNVRPPLAARLARPPAEGNRNNWLTSVAGHLAKAMEYQDGYEQTLLAVNRGLPDPLNEDEVLKTARSVWQAEQDRDVTNARVTAASGFLLSNGEQLLVQCVEKAGDSTIQINRPFADFDLQAHGRLVDDKGTTVGWDIEVNTELDGAQRVILDADDIASPDRFRKWMRSRAAALYSPDKMAQRSMSVTDRIQRYLTSQRPPISEAVEALGWDSRSEAFLTHRGLIRGGSDLLPFEEVQPHPRIAKFAKHLNYGFEADEHEAAGALREVLTYHDEQTMAVFGAWWAMCLLKPQVEEWTSLFPIMVVEAASGAGKTTGAFGMLVRMSGNDAGQMIMTAASMRDRLSAARSAVVWIDDANNVRGLDEIVRALTTGGTMTKKGLDNTDTVEIHLRAPLAFSGESFPWLEEKATRDRTIIIDAPDPSSRMSLHDPTRKQWADLVEWRRLYPEPGRAMAGRLVSMALAREDQVHQWLNEIEEPGGRRGDKIAIIRTGGRLLDSLCGTGDLWTGRVDQWAAAQRGQEKTLEDEDALTVAALPLVLRNERAYPPEAFYDSAPTPAFFDEDGAVWFNADLVEQWLRMHFRGKDQPVWLRHGAEGLRRQAEPIKVTDKRWRVVERVGQATREAPRTTYWQLNDAVSRRVWDRVEGE